MVRLRNIRRKKMNVNWKAQTRSLYSKVSISWKCTILLQSLARQAIIFSFLAALYMYEGLCPGTDLSHFPGVSRNVRFVAIRAAEAWRTLRVGGAKGLFPLRLRCALRATVSDIAISLAQRYVARHIATYRCAAVVESGLKANDWWRVRGHVQRTNQSRKHRSV